MIKDNHEVFKKPIDINMAVHWTVSLAWYQTSFSPYGMNIEPLLTLLGPIIHYPDKTYRRLVPDIFYRESFFVIWEQVTWLYQNTQLLRDSALVRALYVPIPISLELSSL